jgi:hypothetical protein
MLICLLGFFVIMRLRRRRAQLGTPNLSGVQSHQTLPYLQDVSTDDGPRIGPSVGLGVSGVDSGNTPGTLIFPAEAMGTLLSVHHPYAASPDMNMTDNNNSFSFMPPPSLPSMIERTASSQVPSFSDARAEGPASLYPAGVASYCAVSSGGENTYGPFIHEPQEDPFSLPLASSENPQDVESGGGGYPRFNIDGWRNMVGSPPPPSYHTHTTGQ